ncbi:MAG: hypothetical protein K6G64_07770 [Eubacterium sp.]|nr:hypothetical protein [Eubacterium sp.]
MRKKLWRKGVATALVFALVASQYGDFGTKNTVKAGVADEFEIPGTVDPQTDPDNVNARYGARMPYIRFDSENPYSKTPGKDTVTLGGGAAVVKSNDWARSNIATQASNQSYVNLPSNGSYVEWNLVKPKKKGEKNPDPTIGDGVTMRFTMPDSADGMGRNGSLDVYVNDTKVKTVNLTSYFMYQYFSSGHPSDTNDGGTPCFAFDEVHFKLNQQLKEGDRIRIQSSGAGGMEYGVDFLEIETVPEAIEQPANSVNVTSYGAIPNDGQDDYDAIYRATEYADSHNMDVYIPEGTFHINQMWRLYGSNMKITGAGMWYTNIQFTNSNSGSGGVSCGWATGGSKDGYCKNIEFCNMYLNSNLRSRYNQEAVYKCFMDVLSEGSVVHDIWEDHFECGFWLADYNGEMNYSDGIKIYNSRIRNNLADGVNFCQGTSNATVYNCSIRNNGDDGLAMWNNNYKNAKDESNNIFAFNTIDFIWRAGAIAIYGGDNHKIYNNYIRDVFLSAGIHLNTTFDGYKFSNNNHGISFDNNVLVRCGTADDCWHEDLGAVDLKDDTKNITFNNTYIYDSPAEGIRVFGNSPQNTVFNNTYIYGAGLSGQTINYSCINHTGVAIRQGSDSTVYNGLHIANVAPDGYKGTGQENRYWPYFAETGAVGNLSDADIKDDGFTYTVPDYPEAEQILPPENVWEPIEGANFKVTALSWDYQTGKNRLETGDPIVFRVTIENTSDVDIIEGQKLTTRVVVDDGAAYVNNDYTGGLRPGESITLTMNGTCTIDTAGGHTFRAETDVKDYLHETDETDNTRIKNVNVYEGEPKITPVSGGADLQVLKITTDKETINVGDKVRFSALVANAGDQAIPAGDKIGLQFQIDGQPYPAPITWCDTYKSGLQSRATATLTANGGNSESDGTWVATAGNHTITAWVDDTNGYSEVNENNNEYTINLTIPYGGVVYHNPGDGPDNPNDNPTTAEPTTAEPTTKEVTTEEPTTKKEVTTAQPNDIVVSSDVKVEGYQVSTTLGGARTIGSVPKTLNGKQVVGHGIVYALAEVNGAQTGVTDNEIKVGANNTYVRDYDLSNEATLKLSNMDQNRDYFAVTMLFANGGSKREFEATYKTRTYVRLSDGSIVYSSVNDYSIYRISDVLYQKQMMSTRAGHNYLYEKILKVVNPAYEQVDFDWNREIVKFD